MLLLSWNVNKRRPGDLTEKIKSKRPDIVTLQEVKRSLADDWADALKNIGLGYHYRSGNDALALSHQCLIASHWELTPDDIRRPREAPYPESLGRATVSVPGKRDIDVFTAHIPNVGNGWRKIDSFHVLAAELRRAEDLPRILTGDFNEPKQFGKADRDFWRGNSRRRRNAAALARPVWRRAPAHRVDQRRAFGPRWRVPARSAGRLS